MIMDLVGTIKVNSETAVTFMENYMELAYLTQNLKKILKSIA